MGLRRGVRALPLPLSDLEEDPLSLDGVLERHDLPGAAALVAHADGVEIASLGDLAPDSIVRIASIAKPITAAAVMLLVDEGRVRLDDEIARWLPELAEPVVVRTPGSEIDDVVPANRPIGVEDVLTFRAGWGFPADFSLPAVQAIFREVMTWGRPEPFESSDEWVAGLTRVPLLYQPGETWLYNTCSDLQGVLVERVTGQPFADFLAERLFEPLAMADTAFHVPHAKWDRLAPNHDAAGRPAPPDTPSEPPGFASGAGGLVSTLADWHAFGRMLLTDGGDVLSSESVRLMTTDHLTREQREASTLFLEGAGWGFGGSVGPGRRYGWVGGTGTTAHVDPETGTIAVLFTQVPMTGPSSTPLMRDFWAYAFAA